MATSIKAEPYRRNASLYFQDNYSVYAHDITFVDFYSWLDKIWGCKIIVDYKDKKRKEYLIFDDEKKASLFILRFS